MEPHVYEPTLTTEKVEGGFRVTVRFKPGYFRARPPAIGPIMPSIGMAMAAALAQAAPVLTEIATPREYPDDDY